MLELIIGEEEKGKVQDATIPVRWCVSKKTLKELEGMGVLNPHVLIVTVCNTFEMTRQIAPLERLMDYVQFQRPGNNKIFATIVWDDSGKRNEIWKRFLKKDEGEYMTHLVNIEGGFDKPRNSLEFAEVDVVVPKEVFAKEPPKWERWWVNLWFETKPKDQCHFRKRRIMAYTLQPPLVLIWIVFILAFRFIAALVLLLVGFKKINFKTLIHPFDLQSDDVWRNMEHMLSVEKKRKHDEYYPGTRFLWFLLPITPIYPIFLFVVFYIVGSGFWPSLAYTGMVVGASIVVLLIPLIFIVVLGPVFAPISAMLDRYYEKKEKEWREASKKKYEDELKNALICKADLAPEISALPREKRTVHLRFWDLKARVCRPFPK